MLFFGIKESIVSFDYMISSGYCFTGVAYGTTGCYQHAIQFPKNREEADTDIWANEKKGILQMVRIEKEEPETPSDE